MDNKRSWDSKSERTISLENKIKEIKEARLRLSLKNNKETENKADKVDRDIKHKETIKTVKENIKTTREPEIIADSDVKFKETIRTYKDPEPKANFEKKPKMPEVDSKLFSNIKDTVLKHTGSENGKKIIKVLSFIMLFFAIISTIVFVATMLSFRLTLNKKVDIVVPNVVGMDLKSAIQKLQLSKLSLNLSEEKVSSKEEMGKITSQNPQPGIFLKEGAKVELKMGASLENYVIENYVGKNINQVLDLINSYKKESALVVVGDISYIESDQDKGLILSQKPEADTVINSLKKIDFLVSKGTEKELILVENYVGKNYLETINSLAYNNIPFQFELANEYGNGNVSAQSPAPGSNLEIGDVVKLSVNRIRNKFGKVFGILEINLPKYGEQKLLKVDLSNKDGENIQNYFSTNILGGKISFPYQLEKDSIISVEFNNELILEKKLDEN